MVGRPVLAPRPVVVIVMGVTGTGKTTVGRALAERLGVAFADADDYHPPSNVAKMARGAPLTDEDRAPWLAELAGLVRQHAVAGRRLVLACSALKEDHRRRLAGGDSRVVFVHLTGDPAVIRKRMHNRPGHFMPPGLLPSQLEALESPSYALTVDIDRPVAEIARAIVDWLDEGTGIAEETNAGRMAVSRNR